MSIYFSVTNIRYSHVIREHILKQTQLLSLRTSGLLCGDDLVRHPNDCHTREYVVIAGRAKLVYHYLQWATVAIVVRNHPSYTAGPIVVCIGHLKLGTRTLSVFPCEMALR